jgi:hypothetical protein
MWKKLTALYALLATACTSWQAQTAPVPKVVEKSASKGESTIRVELTSGRRYEIYAARIEGDSLIGRNTPTAMVESQRIAVATSDIKRIERHTINTGRTLIAVVAITAAVIAISSASGSSGSSSSSNSSCASGTA